MAARGSGFVVVPLSVARAHHRKDVVHRPVTGVAGSRVGLAWRVDDDDPRIEDFIGVVRGRTERSSRGRAERDGRPRRPGSGSPRGHRTAYRLGPGRHAASLDEGARCRNGALPRDAAAGRKGR